jgi:CheY-like chemotaxis protein
MNVFKRLKRLKTLLVDDDEWIRDAMSIFFASEGCTLQALETAEEALQVCTRDHFDIVIVDYMLPGMNGINFVRALDRLAMDKKSDPPGPMVKILITAHGEDEIVTLARAAGFHEIIHKPFTPEAIENAIKQQISDMAPDY